MPGEFAWQIRQCQSITVLEHLSPDFKRENKMAASKTPDLLNSIANTRADHKVLVVVLDGVGWKDTQDHLTLQLGHQAGVLPSAAFVGGNAVAAAYTPHLSSLMQTALSRTLLAHGPSVGLPSEDDMGNSEVGHNALGAGRVHAGHGVFHLWKLPHNLFDLFGFQCRCFK